MAGATDYDGKPVARGVFYKILVGNRRVLSQPVFECEPLEGRSELVIDLGPCSTKFGCRKWIGKHSVRIRDIRLIQFRM